MRKVKKNEKQEIFTIKSEIRINEKIVLEAGDEIQIIEGNNPYNHDNFWIVFGDNENVLDGFETKQQAEKDLARWSRVYPNVKIIDYDPLF